MNTKDNNIRTCVVTKQEHDKESMLRFAILDDGVIVPDFNKKLCSRGVYVTSSKKALQTAIDKQLFIRSLKSKVKHEKGLVDITQNLLEKKGLDSLSLCKKAGALVVGLDKIIQQKDKIDFFIEATDCGADGHKKVLNMAKEKPIFSLYKSEELDAALGLECTAHLAVIKSKMSKTIFDNLYKLKSFLEN